MHYRIFTTFLLLNILITRTLVAQELLPPAPPWNGKSQELIAKDNNPWITPTEKSGFRVTPSYDETMAWLTKLCVQVKEFKLITIGTSGSNRPVVMLIASSEKSFTKDALRKSTKPLLLVQAGIHAGEIDGKDAGMMLLRDIAFGSKRDLLQGVNILFIPILNVDGHERTSPYNRVNQRGPDNMGWRTNARNLNLNRDFTKLDSDELRAVVKVIDQYEPHLYLDIHVTDGADYQYDITYGYSDAFSPAIGSWLKSVLTPAVDKYLVENGHIPGPLVFAANDIDFTEGMAEFAASGRFSHGYGDLRHLPTILIENHSLKPFQQRVLGTYVFIEGVIRLLASDGKALNEAIVKDRILRKEQLALTWKKSSVQDSITFLGIESSRQRSVVTNSQYVVWSGKPVKQKIPYVRFNVPDKVVSRPKAFWIPVAYKEVIERLRIHGVQMEEVKTAKEVNSHFFKFADYKFSNQPIEGHVTVTGTLTSSERKLMYYPGSVRIDTNQPLGDLIIHLLHPDSPDSFLQWGFFSEIFTRTEYMEQYVSEPLARQMLAADDKLKQDFENEMKNSDFASNPRRIYSWFYERSPYFDKQWLVYPVSIEQ